MARLFKREGERKSLWQRIKDVAFMDATVAMKGLDQGSLERLEELLLANDFGVKATLRLTDVVEDLSRKGRIRTEREFLETVEREILGILRAGGEDTALRFAAPGAGPTVFLMVGVNGVGKTTTTGKLAYRLRKQGRRVLLAAGDTFRAGAIEQLRLWADRAGVDFVGAQPGADPAAVAFDAIDAARSRAVDVVLIDTAGRLHTQSDLMAELAKVERVVAKKIEGAPHETLLVLDATVGQNATAQARTFSQALKLSGLVLAKLDSTAKGGIVVALREEFGIPVKLIGTGEGIDALEPFDAREFAREVLTD
ncbi:MAG: signal recognition particle-docking protein FtsY [Gemmatimonadetes bacterium]|nr:signal recognition particle-docking protein FtsY [Gemmatimonadota bacterium]